MCSWAFVVHSSGWVQGRRKDTLPFGTPILTHALQQSVETHATSLQDIVCFDARVYASEWGRRTPDVFDIRVSVSA